MKEVLASLEMFRRRDKGNVTQSEITKMIKRRLLKTEPTEILNNLLRTLDTVSPMMMW